MPMHPLRVGLLGFFLVLVIAAACHADKDVPDSPKPGKSQSSLDRAIPGPVVRAIYPGACAKVIAETVAEPLEFVMQRYGLLYLRSRIRYENYLLSTNFARATSLTEAEKNVKNRLAVILNILPPLVIKNDVTVSPGVTGVQLFVNLLSPDDSYDNCGLSLYALLNVRDKLARVRGVGAVTVLGSSDYGRCVRLDKLKLRAYSLTPIDVKRAFDTQQKAELKSFEKIGDLVVKTDGKGESVYLRDVATVEIGATKPRAYALLDGKPAVSLMIQPTGSIPPRKLQADLEEKLVEIRKELPKGLELNVTFDFTRNLETPIPATASEYLVVDLQWPDKTPAERRLQTLKQCESEARKVPGVQHVLALTEHPFDLFGTNPCLVVLLSAAEQRKASRDEIIGTLRAKLASVKETTVRVRDLSFPGSWPRCGYPIDLALHGPEREKVQKWGTLFQKRLADTKKLTDVWTSPEPSLKTQFEITIDLAISKHKGLQPEEIVSAVEAAFKIDLTTVKSFAKFGRTIEFVLDSRRIIGFSLRGNIWQADSEEDDRLPDPEKAIGNAKVHCANGELIPLSKFVKIKRSEVPVVDDLLDGKPLVQFSANVAPGVSAEQGRKLCETLAEETRRELKLPAEYRLTWLQ